MSNNFQIFCGHSDNEILTLGFSFFNKLFSIDYSYMIASDKILATYHSHNIGLGVNIDDLLRKGKDFYPKTNINLLYE